MALLPGQQSPRVPGATILLVDDNTPFRDMTEMALSSLGYSVQPCSSPEAALASAHGTPLLDLLMTDMIMAKMNGVQLAVEVRRIHPEIKVLFCSGYPAAALVRQGMDITLGEFLMKPFARDALSSKIAALLGSPGPAAVRPCKPLTTVPDNSDTSLTNAKSAL